MTGRARLQAQQVGKMKSECTIWCFKYPKGKDIIVVAGRREATLTVFFSELIMTCSAGEHVDQGFCRI